MSVTNKIKIDDEVTLDTTDEDCIYVIEVNWEYTVDYHEVHESTNLFVTRYEDIKRAVRDFLKQEDIRETDCWLNITKINVMR